MSDTHEQMTVSELPAILHDGQRDASRITDTDVVDTDGVSPELLDDPSTAAESMGRLLKNRVALAVSFTTRTSDTKEFFFQILSFDGGDDAGRHVHSHF